MPSAHSAFVTSITTAVGIKHGLTNDLFAMGIIFSTIVIYDAINVRFEAGLHAKALNELTGKEYDFNESIGHLPQEAFVGSIIGILVAFVLMSL
jgi:acid phosphatase family membrane protein YuiD